VADTFDGLLDGIVTYDAYAKKDVLTRSHLLVAVNDLRGSSRRISLFHSISV
jgi:hypothetical protein